MTRLFLPALLTTLFAGCSDQLVAPTTSQGPSLVRLPLPPSEHRMNILGSPDTLDSEAFRLNASGSAVGIYRNRWGHTFGVTWDSSGLPRMLADSATVIPTDISDYGYITANQGLRARVYTNPSLAVVLPLPRGTVSSVAQAINWQHTIVGSSTDNAASSRAARWTHQGKNTWAHELLPTTRGVYESAAVDINALGDILGWVRTDPGVVRGWVWFADGTEADLGELASLQGLRINNKQQVLLDGVGTGTVVIHAPSGERDWQLSPSISTVFTALNDAGRVVGRAAYSLVNGTGMTRVPVTHFLPTGRALEELPYSFSFSTFPPGTANDVNLCGTVVGSLRRYSNITSRAVRWEKVGDACDVDDAPVLRVLRTF
jgi:hypothetical protein